MASLGNASPAPVVPPTAESTADLLTQTFLLNYPRAAALQLESLTSDAAAVILQDQPPHILQRVWSLLTPQRTEDFFRAMDDRGQRHLLNALEPDLGAALLSRFDVDAQAHLLASLDNSLAEELRELLSYPENTAGRLMDGRVLAFHQHLPVGQALAQLRERGLPRVDHLFLLDEQQHLCGMVDLQRLVLAAPEAPLDSVSRPVAQYVNTLDPLDEVMEKLEGSRLDVLPVVNVNGHLVGMIDGLQFFDSIKEDLVTDMQTMVGVSKDERALSSAWFAVRKRLPWLQINLLTAFLAASVVGAFEGIIAQYTALAVLLPVAAGQSGNAGAQALAVTMRGLTLREITLRHWLKVMLKEMSTGLINGCAIAVTCGIGVYVWSRSFGLALVMALSMVLSLVIAGMAGALVPMVLKRLGQDPAQSSSIVLTTVTDIAGFMSFLGIATILSSMLTAG